MRRRIFVEAMAIATAARAAGLGRVRVGCQTRAYGSPLPDKAELLAALADLAAAGYEGFETNYRSLEHSFSDPAAMRREIEARGVEMIGLHVGVGLFETAKISEEQQLVERVAKGVRDLGGKHIIVSGRRLPVTADGRAEPEALATKARELARAGKRCKELGVRLNFHNHTHEVRNDAEEIRAVPAQTDPELVSLLFDVGHVHHNEVDVASFVREMHPRLAGLHVRDVHGGDEVLTGTGDVDFARLGAAVQDSGWSGWVIVEVNRPDDMSSEKLVRRARRHLKRTMEI